MNLKFSIYLLIIVSNIATLETSLAQVVIGDLVVSGGSMLHLESEDKGLLIPRVSLDSNTDNTSITPFNTEGLLVYNISNTGTDFASVNEGFYFWDDINSVWKRLYTEGYSEHFQQTTEVISTNTTDILTITNLDKTLDLPFTGTYQVYVTVYYALGDRDNSQDQDGSGYAEVFLEIDGNKEANAFVVSSSKKTETATFNKLAQQTTIIYNVDLAAGMHTFTVKAQELSNRNTATSLGHFGRNTAAFAGNIGDDGINGNEDDDNNAQKGTMTITLLRQF